MFDFLIRKDVVVESSREGVEIEHESRILLSKVLSKNSLFSSEVT